MPPQRKNILFLPNLFTPYLPACSDGMTLSAHELALALYRSIGRHSDHRFILAAHSLSENIDPAVERLLIAAYPADEIYDFGRQHEINDQMIVELLATALVTYGKIDLVVDQTSSETAAAMCGNFNIPCVKTLMLNPTNFNFTPESMPDVLVHTTNFSRDIKQFSTRSAVIHDFVYCPALPPVPHKAEYALSIGRVHKWKGHLEALRVAQKMNMKLKVVGPVFDQEYARLLADEGAMVCGALNREEVYRLLHTAPFLIWTPVEAEPGGRVVVEALKLGTPVICNKTGIASDIIDIEKMACLAEFNGLYLITELPALLRSSAEQHGDRYFEIISSLLPG